VYHARDLYPTHVASVKNPKPTLHAEETVYRTRTLHPAHVAGAKTQPYTLQLRQTVSCIRAPHPTHEGWCDGDKSQFINRISNNQLINSNCQYEKNWKNENEKSHKNYENQNTRKLKT